MRLRFFLTAITCVTLALPLRASSPTELCLSDSIYSVSDVGDSTSNWDDVHFAECRNSCGGCASCYVVAEAMLLERNNGTWNRPMVLADDTGDMVLTTHDLAFDFEGGPRVTFGHYVAPGRAWEISYFGSQRWTDTATATDANNLDIPGPLVAVANDFDNADQMVLTYESKFHNAEFNVVDDRCGWSLLAGFRYLNLDERFNINASDLDGDESDYTAHSANHLYGGQVGARARRWSTNWLSWEFMGKCGLFGNAANQHLLMRDNDNTFELLNTNASRGTVSFVSDVNVTAICDVNDTWSFRAGYYVLCAVGVALAPDQIDFSNDLATGTEINTHGDLVLHGVNLGLEARW